MSEIDGAIKRYRITLTPDVADGWWSASVKSPKGDWRAERSLVRRSPGAAVRAMVAWIKREPWPQWFKRVYR